MEEQCEWMGKKREEMIVWKEEKGRWCGQKERVATIKGHIWEKSDVDFLEERNFWKDAIIVYMVKAL